MSIARCAASDDKGDALGSSADFPSRGGPGSAPSFPGPPLSKHGAIVSSAHCLQRYRNMRAVARAYDPQPAAGGFPYNRRPVAECDPLPSRKANCVSATKPQEYGYAA